MIPKADKKSSKESPTIDRKCCEILKYLQVYKSYWSIVGQERGPTGTWMNVGKLIKP